MLLRVTPSLDTNDFMNFLFCLLLVSQWKNLELQSHSFIHLTLDFCLQWNSSFNNNSSRSCFLKAFKVESLEVNFPSYSTKSILTMSNIMLFFFSFLSPNNALFQSFNFAFTNFSFIINVWPSQLPTWHLYHQLLKLSLNSSLFNWVIAWETKLDSKWFNKKVWHRPDWVAEAEERDRRFEWQALTKDWSLIKVQS